MFRGLLLWRHGDQGVAVFFVLSGFLITHLLLREVDRTEGIDLRKFYFRRTMRIFPPFYVFLLVVAGLSAVHAIPVTRPAWLAAASYTWNYVLLPMPWPVNWAVSHSWSLSLEEQFYLLWPLAMRQFSMRANVRLCVAVILLSPVSRVATYFAWPSMRTHLEMMLHTRLDTIMFGCLLALAIHLKLWERARGAALRWWAPAIALAFLMVIDPTATERWRGMYRLVAGISLENVAIGVIVLYCVARHHPPAGRLLNWRPVRHVGRISYSLYLWQQLFTGPLARSLPLSLGLIFVAAELSFWLVERPSFALRDWMGARLFREAVREG